MRFDILHTQHACSFLQSKEEGVWGIKVLISMVDADQRMVLKAMLTRDIYQCFLCDRIEALPQVLKHHANRWSHNVLFIEHGRYVGGVCVCVWEVLRGGERGVLEPPITYKQDCNLDRMC